MTAIYSLLFLKRGNFTYFCLGLFCLSIFLAANIGVANWRSELVQTNFYNFHENWNKEDFYLINFNQAKINTKHNS